MAYTLKHRCLKYFNGPIDSYKPFRTEINATWGVAERQNVPGNFFRNGDFDVKMTYILATIWEIPDNHHGPHP